MTYPPRLWFRRAVLAAAATAVAWASVLPVQAAAFPDRALRLVVPFGAGGSDGIARVFADKLSKVLDQPVYVENRAGAAGLIGSEYVARSTPDGYTMLFIGGGSFTPALIKGLQFNILKEMRPVISIARGGMTLMVNAQVPANTIEEFVEYAKRNPGKLNYSHTASSIMLSSEMTKQRLGFDAVGIPYKGAAQVLTAQLTNEVQMTIDVPLNYLPMIKEGKIRALLHGGQDHIPPLADGPHLENVPTLSDKGIKDLIFAVSYGIWVPADTPDDAVLKLNAAYNEVLKDPEIKLRLNQAAMVPVGGAPQIHAEQVHAEQEMWKRSAQQIGFKPE